MDTIDQREHLGKPFLGSLATHGAIVGVFFAFNVLHLTNPWGSPTPTSGTVGVTMVTTIPIQRHQGPVNPLANDTKNIVPQETMQVKVKPEEKAPDPKAIALEGKVEKPKKAYKPVLDKSLFKAQAYKPNQVYSTEAQAASSPMYGIKGSGGIGIGPESVLGSRFGAYVNLMSSQISQHWNRADVRARPTDRCAVTFTIARSGAVSNVQISQPSGNLLLDNSAKRAIIDSNPLPSLPPNYPGNDVTVELWFQLTQ